MRTRSSRLYDLYIPDSVAPEDAETASDPDSSGGTSDWSLDGLLQRAVDARLQRKAKDTKALCPKYDGYDKSIDVGHLQLRGPRVAHLHVSR